MTRPLPPGPRFRTSVACLTCRKAKAKCDGEQSSGKSPRNVYVKAAMPNPAEGSGDAQQSPSPCSRCVRLGCPCMWVSSRRSGTSRKKPADSREGSREGTNADFEAIQNTDDASTGATLSAGDTAFEISPSEMQEALDALLQTTPGFNPPLPTEESWLQILSDNPLLNLHPASASSPDPPTAATQEIIALYYTHVHHFCPILPGQTAFLAKHYPSASSLLIAAMGALASPYSPTPLSTDYHQLALSLLQAEKGTTPVLQQIQALILLVHVAYGLVRYDLARSHLKTAFHLATSSGLYQRDLSPVAGLTEDPKRADLERKAWWELWALDASVQLISGEHHSLFQNIQIAVNLPQDWIPSAPNFEPSAFALQARTFFLLTASSSSNSVITTPEEFKAVGTALANLLVLSRECWERSGELELRSEGEEASKWRASRDAAFMALLMNHCAVIHLRHRQHTVLGELTRDFHACSLGPAEQRTIVPQTTQNSVPPIPYQPFTASIIDTAFPSSLGFPIANTASPSQIVAQVPPVEISTASAAAQGILMVIREDYEHHQMVCRRLRTLEGPGSSSSGVVGLNMHRPSHSPFFACSQVIAAYGLLLELLSPVNCHETVTRQWRDLELESELDMIEETLRRQGLMWEVAADCNVKLKKFRATMRV